MLDQMREQYVVTARAKGVAEWLVVAKHALKNTGVTTVTMGGWELGRMIAGYTVVVEVVFAWPGMGHLVFESIKQGDFALVQALALVIAVLIGLLNLSGGPVVSAVRPSYQVRVVRGRTWTTVTTSAARPPWRGTRSGPNAVPECSGS